MQHTISVLVKNKFGALARIAGLFCGRGFNIESLTVSPTSDAEISKMTIVTIGDEAILEQIEKQLCKLIDVISVTDLTDRKFIERELIIIKISASSTSRSEIMQITDIFNGKVVNVNSDEITAELSGRSEKINAFVKLIEPFGIVELARTGRVALSRQPGITE